MRITCPRFQAALPWGPIKDGRALFILSVHVQAPPYHETFHRDVISAPLLACSPPWNTPARAKSALSGGMNLPHLLVAENATLLWNFRSLGQKAAEYAFKDVLCLIRSEFLGWVDKKLEGKGFFKFLDSRQEG